MTETRWRMLLLLFVARTALGLQFQTVGSTAPYLRDAFGIGFVEIGTLIGCYMLPGVILSLPGGLLVRQFGDRALCCTGLLLMALGGVLIGVSQGYGLALCGRLISGTGSVFLGLSVTKMTTDWFSGREMVSAMGILVTSWPLGIALGLVAFAPLAQAYGWPSVMILTAAFCCVGFGLIAAFYRKPSRQGAAGAQSLTPPHSLFQFPSLAESLPAIVAGLVWGVFNLGLVCFFSFAPTFLVQHGSSLSEGAFLTSLVLWALIVTIPLGGQWLQRSLHPDAGVMLFSGAAGLVLAMLAFSPSLALAIAPILGVLIGPPPGAIMAMPGRVLRPENRAVGLGLFMTAYNIITAVGPSAAGALNDSYGAGAPLVFGGAVFVSVAPLTVLYRALSRPAVREGSERTTAGFEQPRAG